MALREKLERIKDEKEKKQAVSFLARLISAKFSGSKQANLAVELAFEKIVFAFENKLPIIFVFGFGGYKNYNSPSFPQVDFAELFHLKFLTSYLLPLIKEYKYGIEIEYESEEISIQFNNVPQHTTDEYTKTFKKLLNCYVSNFEKENDVKLNINLVVAREMYSPNDLYLKMKEYYPQMEKIYLDLSAEEKEVWFKRAATNFLVKGTVDYSNLSVSELKAKIIEARINNECFLAADYDLRIDFWERPSAISLFGTWGKTPCASPTDAGLHLKSTSSSNTDFWIGTGIFEIRGDGKINERILSRLQFESVKDSLVKIEVSTPLSGISKNFDFIYVYQGTLNF